RRFSKAINNASVAIATAMSPSVSPNDLVAPPSRKIEMAQQYLYRIFLFRHRIVLGDLCCPSLSGSGEGMALGLYFHFQPLEPDVLSPKRPSEESQSNRRILRSALPYGAKQGVGWGHWCVRAGLVRHFTSAHLRSPHRLKEG